MKNSCFLINELTKPKLAVVYVFVGGGNPNYSSAANNFCNKVRQLPAGIDHETIVMCNGAAPTQTELDLFNGLPNLRFIQDDNRAYDISAFQTAGQNTDADIILLIGVSTYPTRKDWGKKVVEITEQYGSGIYGSMGNQGDQRFGVFPHIRTTGFWLPTKLFNEYPVRINRADQRYPFEHGKECITEWVRSKGLPAMVVGWHDVRDISQADSLPNGFHRGDQSNLIFRDRLTEPPYYNS